MVVCWITEIFIHSHPNRIVFKGDIERVGVGRGELLLIWLYKYITIHQSSYNSWTMLSHPHLPLLQFGCEVLEGWFQLEYQSPNLETRFPYSSQETVQNTFKFALYALIIRRWQMPCLGNYCVLNREYQGFVEWIMDYTAQNLIT